MEKLGGSVLRQRLHDQFTRRAFVENSYDEARWPQTRQQQHDHLKDIAHTIDMQIDNTQAGIGGSQFMKNRFNTGGADLHPFQFWYVQMIEAPTVEQEAC